MRLFLLFDIYYFYLICPMKLTWGVWGLFKWRFRNICIYYQIITLWYTRHDKQSAFLLSSVVKIVMISLFFRSHLGTSDSLVILFSEVSFHGFSQFVMWAFLGKKVICIPPYSQKNKIWHVFNAAILCTLWSKNHPLLS